jgi:hypothetical protein
MALNINNLTPASLKAKEVATQEYVDTSTSGMLTDANFNTNITTIDGGKIATGSITAQQINTTGLIAENISGTNIISKTISGSVIQGAYIEGAVIKASYLDLDGELEVLTNYHISTSSYDSNLMPGAIYIAGSDEYRLPTTSSIETISPSFIENETNVFTSNQPIYPYNSYWTTSTRRAAKIRPTLTIPSDIELFHFTVYPGYSYSPDVSYDIYIGGINIGTYAGHMYGTLSSNTMRLNGLSGLLVYNNITFEVYNYQVSGSSSNPIHGILRLKAGNYTLAYDWTSEEFIKIVFNSGTTEFTPSPPSLGNFTLNNMV